MRSSTFSFDRCEDGFSIWPFATGLLFGVVFLMIIEFSWRLKGAAPGYVDSEPRWSWVRSEVADRKGVVLLGDSRMHFGFSLAAFRDRHPDTPIHQLAVAGAFPYASMRDLANDETFRGTTIISFMPEMVMAFRREDQEANVRHYRKRWNIDGWLNLMAGSLAERYLVTRHHNYGLNSIFRFSLRTGRLPPAELDLETTFDREIHADYSIEGAAQHRRGGLEYAQSLIDDLHPVSPQRWRAELNDFLDLARAIHNRGGCVVAIRFPSQGEVYIKEQYLFPKQEFWSALDEVPYLTSIHFEDLDVMDDITLPDLHHIDKADKYRFTAELVAQIDKAIGPIGDHDCAAGP